MAAATATRSRRTCRCRRERDNLGRLRCERHGIRGLVEAGVPAAEVVGELIVEDAGADLQ